MKPQTCPDLKTLELLLLGNLPAAQRETIEEHFLECDLCVAVAETNEATDELIEALQAKQVSRGYEKIIARAIERGKQLRSKMETAQTDDVRGDGRLARERP